MKQTQRRFLRFFTVFLAGIMLILTVSACVSQPSGTSDQSATTAATTAAAAATTAAKTTAQATTAETELADGGVTNPTGYEPIVNSPITLKANIVYGAHMGDVTKYEIWKTIEEKTNIKIELNVLSDTEKVDLTFATRDYPDISFRIDAKSAMVMDAADRKSVV